MDIITKQWNLEELKEKLRIKYPQLTETDLQHEEGMEESMFRMVEYKLHKTKPEMQNIIAEL
jgi:hypothetical protein